MKLIIFALVAVIPLMFLIGMAVGYRVGFRRIQGLNLRSLGLSGETATRYRDAMRLLHAMVEASTLDGPYAGNILTHTTETEARRIVDGYRKEMGLK
jgi:hypothetical protein